MKIEFDRAKREATLAHRGLDMARATARRIISMRKANAREQKACQGRLV
jgi:uncharacterized DUF497 family protein